jgi:hypothetical protein
MQSCTFPRLVRVLRNLSKDSAVTLIPLYFGHHMRVHRIVELDIVTNERIRLILVTAVLLVQSFLDRSEAAGGRLMTAAHTVRRVHGTEARQVSRRLGCERVGTLSGISAAGVREDYMDGLPTALMDCYIRILRIATKLPHNQTSSLPPYL